MRTSRDTMTHFRAHLEREAKSGVTPMDEGGGEESSDSITIDGEGSGGGGGEAGPSTSGGGGGGGEAGPSSGRPRSSGGGGGGGLGVDLSVQVLTTGSWPTPGGGTVWPGRYRRETIPRV